MSMSNYRITSKWNTRKANIMNAIINQPLSQSIPFQRNAHWKW